MGGVERAGGCFGRSDDVQNVEGVNGGEGSERSEGGVVWEGEGDWIGGGGGVANGSSQGAVDLGDFIVEGEEERVAEVG